jgi:hypothetical protein
MRSRSILATFCTLFAIVVCAPDIFAGHVLNRSVVVSRHRVGPLLGLRHVAVNKAVTRSACVNCHCGGLCGANGCQCSAVK